MTLVYNERHYKIDRDLYQSDVLTTLTTYMN